MKKLLILLFLLSFFFTAKSQFDPSIHVVLNDALGQSQAAPIEGRGMFWDQINFRWRDFQNTSEVLSTLPTNANRFSHFPIWVHVGGSLSGGVWTGGISQAWFFKDGLTNGNLVRWYTDTTILRPAQDSMWRLNDSTIAYTINGGSLRTVLIRGTAAGGISSLQMTAPSIFNSPVNFSNTGGAWSGTLNLAAQNANYIWGGPTAGAPAQPTFRQMVAADLPTGIPNGNLANSSITTTMDNTGTVPGFNASSVALGGTLLFHNPASSATTGGYLTSTDWIRFNNAAMGQVTSVNGQVGAVITLNADSIWNYPIDITNYRNGWVLALDTINGKLIFSPPLSGSGITSLNGLTTTSQSFALGNSGTSPNIISSGSTHTFNTPIANGADTGIVTPGLFNFWNAKQAALSGTGYLNFTGTTPSYFTPTQVTADLNLFTSTLKGLVPLSGGGTTNFLRSDGTWAAPPGGGSVSLTNAHIFVGNVSNVAMDVALTGDIGITNAGLSTIQANAVTTTKIINNAVTYAKIQAASGQSLLGATGAGNFGEITLGTNLSMAGSVLNATGTGSGIAQLFTKNDAIGILGTDTVKMDTTKYQRIFNVTNPKYGLNPSEAVDATVAVQAVINDCYANGGGKIFFPGRTYLISGALVTSTPQGQNPNAQITIPFTSLRAANAISMEMIGDRPPSYEKSIVTTGYVPPNHGYTIFLSTIVGSGTTPAVFGNVDSLFGTQRWNATAVTWRNMIVRTTTKTSGGVDTVGTMSAMNMNTSTEIQMIDFVADVTSEAFTSVMPASTTIGIWLPHANNSAWNYLSRVQIQGYFTGLNANEHTFADYLFISACDTAIQCDDMNHDIHIVRLLLNGTVHGIHATNNCYIKVDNFDTEHMIPSCRTVWYEFKDDVKTETTYGIIGNINYHAVRSCGSPHPEDFTVVNTASATLSPPNLSWSYMNQSPLPLQTLIGNGAVTTNAVFNQPNSAGITINSYKGRDAEMMYMANSDSTNQYFAEGVINAKNNKAPWTNVGTKYLSVNSVQFVEKFLRPSDTASVTALTRDAYQFKLGVPFVPLIWTTATRPTLGVVTGMTGINSDSISTSCSYEYWNGSAWVKLALTSGGGYTLPIASASVLGGIKIGSGLAIDGTGIVSVTGSTPPNGGAGYRIYSPQVPQFRSLFCVGCTWDSTSNTSGLTLTVPSVSGFQSVLTNNPALTTSNYITGNTKSWMMSAFDTISVSSNYTVFNTPVNINAATPTLNLNASNGSARYAGLSANSSTGEVQYFCRSGGFFPTWYSNNAEMMRGSTGGNLLIGVGANKDSLALLQLAAATAARAQIFFTPTGTGPNGTNIKNGHMWYDSVLHGLFFRDQGVSKNLLTGSSAPFADNAALVKNNSDNTKLLILSAASIATGTTRTATFPDANITVADKLTGLNQFASTTSAQLLGVISDETGTGSLVFGTSPSIATPLLTGLTSSGANDSVVTVDPTTGQTHRRSGIFNLYFDNGLQVHGGDSVRWGGSLDTAMTITGGSGTYPISLGTNASQLSNFSVYSNSINLVTQSGGSINANGPLNLLSLGSASGTTNYSSASDNIIKLATPTANRTLTLPTSGTNTGRIINILNQSTSASFSWTFATTVLDGTGATIIAIPNGVSYFVYYDGTSWYLLNNYNANGGAIKYQHTIFTPTTGGTVNLINNQYNIINPAAPLATLTINLPSSPNNNDVVYIKFDSNAPGTVTYANGTFTGGIAAPVVGGVVTAVFDSGTNAWY